MISSKKIFIPGIEINELKALNKLFLPSCFLIPMCFGCLIAQMFDNLKGILSVKEIQQLYSKILCVGKSFVSLSALYSILKNLGYELETLFVLPIKQRIQFLPSLLKNFLEEKRICRINNFNCLFSNLYKLIQQKRISFASM